MNTELKILYTGTTKEDSQIIEEILKKQGFNFVWKHCANKSDFVHALYEFSPHVVLCEDRLGAVRPLEALHLSKKSGSGISFLLIATELSDEQISALAKEGLDDFVYKDRLQLLPQAIKTARIRQSLKNTNTARNGITTERTNSLNQNSNEALVLCNENYDIIYCTPSLESVIGWRPDNTKVNFFSKWMHSYDLKPLNELKESLKATKGTEHNVVLQEVPKNSPYDKILLSATNLLNDPHVRAIVIHCKGLVQGQSESGGFDKTPAEPDIRMEHISDSTLLINERGEILYQSPSVKHITGLEIKDSAGKTLFDLIHPNDLEKSKSFLKEASLKSGYPVYSSIRISHKHGHHIAAEGTITNLVHTDNASSYLINYRDVSERKHSERLLQKSEANLRTIFDNTNVAYVLSDRKFRVISFNPSALTIYKKEFKVDLKEGDNLMDYLPEERKILSKERFERALSGEKVNYEMSFAQPKGNKNWYNVNMFAVRDKNNTLLGFIISSEDITGRKNIELERTKMLADIVQHNKDLEQFSYIISHNLRSPVANIIGLSTIIKNADQMNKPDFDRCIDGLVLSASKLDEIIVDLNFILQRRREINEKKEMVSFSSLLNDVKTIISELTDRENILIHSNFTVNKIFTVRSYLHSIFLNLITNSIKYRDTAKTTVIDISAHKIDNRIILSFKDNGMGIDLKNYGDKLFGLYKKFHTHIEGKGMGLYMVKTQVEILGGKISVQSQVGKGTEFTIAFEL